MNKGFNYTLDREDIINYMKLSDAEKLQWLEDILSFTEKALRPEDKSVRDYFRNDIQQSANSADLHK